MQCAYGNILSKTAPILLEHIQKYTQKDKNYTFVLKPIFNEDYPYIDGFEFKIEFKIGKGGRSDKTNTL